MDYLVYVEGKAENLQFFLWYCDYVERWSSLLPRQKLLSPVWDPDKGKGWTSGPRVAIHKRSDSEKLTNIITIMERKSISSVNDGPANRHSRSASSSNLSQPRSPAVLDSAPGAEPRSDWQPCKPAPAYVGVGMVTGED